MGQRGRNAKPMAFSRGSILEGEKASWEDPKYKTRLERTIAFIEACPISSGKFAGTEFRLRPFQTEIIQGLHLEDENGRRIVREAVISLPRKNGKTGLIATVALCHLCGPQAIERGMIRSAASARHQAAFLFNEMVAIVERTPWLRDRIMIRRFTKELEDVKTGSIYQALSAEATSEHGANVSCWIYDELAQAQNRQLYDVLSTSTGGREEPLGIVISTQSDDPRHIMSELYDEGERWIHAPEDERSPSFYAYIRSAPQDADVWNEQTWFECNPALNDFRSLEELRDFSKKAKRSPSKETAFRLLYMNQRFSPAEKRIFPREEWIAGRVPREEWPELVQSLEGRECYGGLDLSSRNDLTAMVLVFPVGEDLIVLPHFWTRENGLRERESQDRATYRLWADQGHLHLTPGEVIDYTFIATELAELATKYEIKAVAADPWSLLKFEQAMQSIGADHIPIFKHGQSWKDMSPAIATLEDLVLKRQIKHNANPVMDWCIDNARAVMDAAGNRRFDKVKSTGRIDGIVALAMAANTCDDQAAGHSYVEGSLIMV